MVGRTDDTGRWHTFSHRSSIFSVMKAWDYSPYQTFKVCNEDIDDQKYKCGFLEWPQTCLIAHLINSFLKIEDIYGLNTSWTVCPKDKISRTHLSRSQFYQCCALERFKSSTGVTYLTLSTEAKGLTKSNSGVWIFEPIGCPVRFSRAFRQATRKRSLGN